MGNEMDTGIHKQLIDTQIWRTEVMTTLAEIRLQMGHLVADRISEKETLRRITQDLRADQRDIQEQLDEHIKEDTEQFRAAAADLHQAQRKISMIVGIGLGVNAMIAIVMTLWGMAHAAT